MSTSSKEHLISLASLGALATGGFILGMVNSLSAQPEQRPIPTPILSPTPEGFLKVGPGPIVAREIPGRHYGLVPLLYKDKGLRMFTPSLDIQAAQAGATLLRVTPYEQFVPSTSLGILKRRVPGPKQNIFPSYEVRTDEDQVLVVAKAETINNETGQPENYLLLGEACRVSEMPSTEHTRQLLSTAPASIDTGDKILFASPCWVLELRPPFEWPEKFPATGRK